ncbi:hypothetical protein GCM10010392_12180 [Streptomyces clavifer]|nr:hypothetical protein GCM10010392_12180 [Streptomyces clavifer]
MAEPSRLQIYEVERSSDQGGVCTARCISGIARVGQTLGPDGAEEVSADSLITLKAIERYGSSVDFFDPPGTARVFLAGESVKALSRGSIISEVY